MLHGVKQEAYGMRMETYLPKTIACVHKRTTYLPSMLSLCSEVVKS